MKGQLSVVLSLLSSASENESLEDCTHHCGLSFPLSWIDLDCGGRTLIWARDSCVSLWTSQVISVEFSNWKYSLLKAFKISSQRLQEEHTSVHCRHQGYILCEVCYLHVYQCLILKRLLLYRMESILLCPF